jgi:hypothetical protein
VSTQTTGAPEFDVAAVPAGPQGMPTAGRVSGPAGVVVGDGECGLVVGGTVVAAAEAELVGGAVVAADDAVAVGGVVVWGARAVIMGGGIRVAGAGRRGGILLTEEGDGVSTLGDVSSD